MAAMKFFTIATTVIGLISSTIAWNFSIKRNSTDKLDGAVPVVESIDKFNISDCSSRSDICKTFSGQNLEDGCQCVCTQDKSTFGFYNSKWGCTENSIVQQHAGRNVYGCLKVIENIMICKEQMISNLLVMIILFQLANMLSNVQTRETIILYSHYQS